MHDYKSLPWLVPCKELAVIKCIIPRVWSDWSLGDNGGWLLSSSKVVEKKQLVGYDYYELKCANVESMVKDELIPIFLTDPTAPQSLLRLLLHDSKFRPKLKKTDDKPESTRINVWIESHSHKDGTVPKNSAPQVVRFYKRFDSFINKLLSLAFLNLLNNIFYTRIK
ncbi:hypothetical protein LguiA_033454 [Lonicera macranthoides]